MAINTAAIDTRIKATVASTMYDMSRVTANGYFDSANNAEARHEARKALMAQRTEDFKAVQAGGTYKLGGGVVDPLPEDAPYFVKDYYDYYKTPRGYHERSLNSNGGWNVTAATSLLNTKLLAYAEEIQSAVMVLHDEKAHSRYFGEDAFKRLTGNNTELVIIPGASHTDLYDGGKNNAIPFDKLAVFTEKIIQGQKDGIINKDLIPKLVYPAIISNIFIPISAFDFLLDDNSSSEKIKHIKSFILKGIRNE